MLSESSQPGNLMAGLQAVLFIMFILSPFICLVLGIFYVTHFLHKYNWRKAVAVLNEDVIDNEIPPTTSQYSENSRTSIQVLEYTL